MPLQVLKIIIPKKKSLEHQHIIYHMRQQYMFHQLHQRIYALQRYGEYDIFNMFG